MNAATFSSNELAFEWCNRIYFGFRTHRRKPIECLQLLDKKTFSELLVPYGIHVLEFSTNSIEIRTLVSLTVSDLASSAASKIKGRLSKWISNRPDVEPNTKQNWLGRGYFAATAGKSTAEDVSAYLEPQGEHHGYHTRPQSPVYVRTFDRTVEEERLLNTDHAVTRLRYHLVLASDGIASVGHH